MKWTLLLLCAAAFAPLIGCQSKRLEIAPEVALDRVNESIVACGERIHVGVPVILWTDPGGYSAYKTDLHFNRPLPGVAHPPAGKLRYKPGRYVRGTDTVMVEPETGTIQDLKRELDLFVLHYDACLTSQECFRTLQDERALSVHFMLDLDGTIYQTLDLRDTAWHAAQANPRSVGIEIANIGAYELTSEGDAKLARYYPWDDKGPRLNLPGTATEMGIRTPAFEARPARQQIQRGEVHGNAYQQYDFTREQYASLVKLTAALCSHFPNLNVDVPRDENGRVLHGLLSPQEEAAYHGILGHYHVSIQKRDPGPAFDWEVFLTRVRTRLGRL